MWNDDVWDEERWEAFLRENDKRVDRYMELIFSFMVDHPRPSPDHPEALQAWEKQLRAFLEEQGWQRGDEEPPFLSPGGAADPSDLEDDDGSSGGPLLGADDVDDFRTLPIYRQAFQLTADVLDWAESLPPDVKDSTLVHFCSNVNQIPANVAKGHGIGYERDMIGGNIACVKRALRAANEALTLLYELKGEPFLTPSTYQTLYEQTYEMRNALGLYIQELRRRFDLGID